MKPNKVQARKEPRTLDPEERRAYVRTVRDAGDRQHILIVRLGFDGGLRVAEMASLRWARVKVTAHKGEMEVEGKGTRPESSP